MINFNSHPYFDDIENANGSNYHKILFVPGSPVQARELTQIQSILQEQVKRQGDHLFKNGTKIQGGEIFYDNTVTALKVSDSYNSSVVDAYATAILGKKVLGMTTGVEAQVIHYDAATKTEPATFYVKYTAANGANHTFQLAEILFNAELNVEIQVQAASNAITPSSIVTINEGIFYANGYFVGVAKQTISLNKYDKLPSFLVGLHLFENIITSSSDANILDNALGFPNYAAPGAHRYQIKLILTKKNPDNTDIAGELSTNFISLLKVDNGNIQYLYNDTQYAEIEKMLARRTYDESGDYVVNDFSVKTRDYRNNNRGQWLPSTPYAQGDVVTNNNTFYVAKNTAFSGTTAPVQAYGEASDGGVYWLQVANTLYNSGLYQATWPTLQEHINANSKFAVTTSSGKAYIKGFEVNVQDSRVITANKAREVKNLPNAQIYSPVGQYALIKNVAGIIDTSTMLKVSLKDPSGTAIGSAWATTMEYVEGTIGTTAATYKLYLFNIAMNAGNDFADDVLTVADAVGTTFSATFVQSSMVLSGIVSTTASSAVVTGKGTLFTQDLRKGDQIVIGGVSKVVLSITNDSTFTATTTFATAFTDVPCSLQIVTLYGSSSYIQPMPQSYLATLRATDGSIDTSYTVQKTITFAATGTSATVTLSALGETFMPTGHIVYEVTTGNIIPATYSLDVTAKVLTITGTTNARSYKMIGVVKRVGAAAKEKAKTLKTKSIIVLSNGVTDDFGNVLSSTINYTQGTISLTEADAVRIIKVTQSGSVGAYNATGEVDATAWFTLDPNVQMTYYGQSSMIRKPTTAIPTKALKVTFEFFDHSKGDYFSVDSYATIPYERIPTTMIGSDVYYLSDCLDFRSRLADDGLSFSGTGGSISTPLYSSSTISTSYSHYLPRVDVLALDSNGQFEYFEGMSKENPVAPTLSDGALLIATLFVSPYTINAVADVSVTLSKHKRFTMTDISDIESRVTNVEYYVALTELEKATSQMKVIDGNGLDRYKNGFIVDSFSNSDVSDLASGEVLCTFETSESCLRPAIVASQISLREPAGVTDASRLANGYQVTGDYITLPYTEQPLVSQMIATRDEFVNPFAVFKWSGDCRITPDSDQWIETLNPVNTTTVVGPTTVVNLVYDYRNNGTVICTYMFKIGEISLETYKLDAEFGQMIILKSPHVYDGYIVWATKLVSIMERDDFIGKVTTSIVTPFAKAWAVEMARQMGKDSKLNLFGWCLMKVGIVGCGMIGRLLNMSVRFNKGNA